MQNSDTFEVRQRFSARCYFEFLMQAKTCILKKCLRNFELRLRTSNPFISITHLTEFHSIHMQLLKGTLCKWNNYTSLVFSSFFRLLLEIINFKATAISSISGDRVDAIRMERTQRLQSRTYNEINQSITPRLQSVRDGVFRCKWAFSRHQCWRQLGSSLAEVLITLMEFLQIHPATSSRSLKQDGCLFLQLGSHCRDNRWSVFILIKNLKINVGLSSCLPLSVAFSVFLSSCHPLGFISQSLILSLNY